MNTTVGDAVEPMWKSVASRLNRSCFCITLDQQALSHALEVETGDPEFCSSFISTRPFLFSNVPVFLSSQTIMEMGRIATAIETTAQLPAYRKAVLAWAPDIAQRDHGPLGAFMGYDFHLDGAGPKLIEINTNAGGAFLNSLLGRAQLACCDEVEAALHAANSAKFETDVASMFQQEFHRQRGSTSMPRIAIVDDHPQEQYLYPEFLLALQMFRKMGFDAIVADPQELHYDGGRLLLDGREIGFVYNRLVDFALERPEHKALSEAYREGAVVVSPNPHNHAVLGNKRNLTLLSDPTELATFGLEPETRDQLNAIPRTFMVNPDNADTFWRSRKDFFFKPTSGYGSKAVYRGDKVTRRVWTGIERGGYVAQEFAAPGERKVMLDGVTVSRKMDVRLYTYAGQILLTTARLYQGQTTNFRTPGGGFAPVIAI